MEKYAFFLYSLAWFLFFFIYASTELNDYIRSLGYGISVAGIVVWTLYFIKFFLFA